MLVQGNQLTFDGEQAASLVVEIQPGGVAPVDLIAVYNAPGGVTVYVGERYEAPWSPTGAVVLPTRVDWQILYGLGPCQCSSGPARALRSPLWETTPGAVGSTFLVATPNREGVLWHASVPGATSWLLRASTTQATKLRVTLAFRPWECCGSGAPVFTAGSALG